MIESFRHKGLERFFETGSKAGIQPKHAAKLGRQLAVLDSALNITDIDVPGWQLHSLSGDEKGQWSIWVNGNWRVTFEFDNGQVFIVDYRDYH